MLNEARVDVLVVGGGVGGVAAALAATDRGASVILTEESDWLGGQLTSQAVPPDEHPWIEDMGCTARYRSFRDRVRETFRATSGLREASRREPHLNPGGAWVGSVCHLPTIAVDVIDQMLAPARAAGRLTVLLEHEPLACDVDGDTVRAVTFRDRRTGRDVVVQAAFVLDATETGELLPLSGTEYVSGRESAAQTGEPHAPGAADPLDMQAVTVCFAVDHLQGENFVEDAPAGYEWWRNYHPQGWPGPLLSWDAPAPHTGETRRYSITPNPAGEDPNSHAGLVAQMRSADLWTYRRVLAAAHFEPGAVASDVTMVNWPMTDYWLGPLFGEGPEQAARHAEGARELARSFLHWMRTEAPRSDGGTGWPGLRLRPDVMGTADGLAKRPYIRESRRLQAMYTVPEQDLAADVRGEHGAVRYHDSVGIGSYRIDLHPSTGGSGYLDIAAWPFQIPLRALVPQRTVNLLAAAKNIGTTHITNGCYRLHPVEWNVGEAAGTLAAFCLERRTRPHAVVADESLLGDYRAVLTADGAELAWPEGSVRPV